MATLSEIMESDQLSVDCLIARDIIRRMIEQAKEQVALWNPGWTAPTNNRGRVQ